MMMRTRTAADWAALVLGIVILLIGVVLAIGGAWLVSLGGSLYYLAAGIGLAVSGLLLANRRAEGAWLYIGIFVATLAWAWWEVGANGWALVPRTVGPLVLLIGVLAISPQLYSRRSGTVAAIAAAACLVVVAGGGFAIFGPSHRAEAAVGVVPPPQTTAMADPSPLQPGADWPAYGGSYAARRYSPLDQINRDNVATLTKVWTFHTADLPNERTRGTYGAETTPLKIGDTLYLCTPKNIMIALDPPMTASSAGATIPRCPTRTFPTPRPAAAWCITRCRTPIRRRPAPPASSKARWMPALSRSTPRPASPAPISAMRARSTPRSASVSTIPGCSPSPRRRPSFAA